ncbi:MAG: TolC family protein, partial [Proteobacteria bacterium]|nr:TolC family protein [Pseudomonadota bacterium]
MKIKVAALLALCLFYGSPLSADYSKMNDAFNAYSPPVYYTDSLEVKAIGPESLAEPAVSLDAVFLEINALKKRYEKKTGDMHENFFLSGIDMATFNRLVDISLDQEAVWQIISHGLKLHEIEVIAGLRNPSVLAAQKNIKAELESFTQVMGLDNTLTQYSAFTKGVNNKIGPLKMKDSIKQKFPYPGLTSLKGRIIHQQVAVLVEEMRIAQKNSITDTRKAYWDIVFIDQSIRATSETIDAFTRLKDVATALYKSGKTSFQDIIKINIKIEVLKEDLITLSSRKKNIEAKLSELLNIPANTKMGEVVLSQFDKTIPGPEDLFSLARENRQELKVIQHKINKVQDMIEMAESMIQEPFTLGFSANEDEAVISVGSSAMKPSFPEKTMASMKNNSPIKPWYGIDDPWLNQTKQILLSIKQTLVKQENAADRMVREAWFSVDRNKRELDLYKNRILSLSKSALDVSTREY